MAIFSVGRFLLGMLIVPAVWAGGVEEFTLDNGLKLLVREDHRAPVVVSQIWYKVGSSYEPLGKTGVSHVLEHMMFKATQTLESGEFSRIISENGGDENAFTASDYTAYYQKLEASRVSISFKLEADRMQNLIFNRDEFEKERQVVIEERRMRTDDKPEGLFFERFNAIAHLSSPYRNPIIGWRHDLENLTLDDLKQWYRRWYAPNNATLVVVGDVKAQEVFKLAKAYFGDIPARPVEPLRPQMEVETFGSREAEIQLPAKLPTLMIGFRVPSFVTAEEAWEPYALEVLSGILSGGGSSRLTADLVRGREMAVAVDTSYGGMRRLDDMFLFSAKPVPGKSVEALKEALTDHIEKMKTERASEQELQRVKAQVIASKVFERDSQFYQAMQLGVLSTIGLDWRIGETYEANIKAVTTEQVQAVAKKYFRDDRRVTAVLKPLMEAAQ